MADAYDKPGANLTKADTHNKSGAKLLAQNRVEEALHQFNKALPLYTSALGKHHIAIAGIWNNIGIAHRCLHDHSHALQAHVNALHINEAFGGNVGVAGCLQAIGSVHLDAGRYKIALTKFEEALAIYRELYDPGHLSVADAHTNVGICLYSVCRFGEALEAHNAALNIRMQADAQLDVAKSRDNIGTVHKAQGDTDKALDEWQKSLEIKKRLMPEGGIDAARTLNNIALAHSAKGNHQQAISSLTSVLGVFEEALGKENLHVARTKLNLGTVYLCAGRYTDAHKFYEESAALKARLIGTEHVKYASSLVGTAHALKKLGKLEEAMVKFKIALCIRKNRLGPTHLDVAATHNIIGSVYYDQKRFDKAVDAWETELAIRLSLVGEQHPSVAVAQGKIAAVYIHQGKFAKALELLRKQLAVQEMLGTDQLDLAKTYNSIGHVHVKQGNHDDALDAYTRSLESMVKVHGRKHPDVAATQAIMGSLYRSSGKFSESIKMYTDAHAACSDLLVRDHPTLLGMREVLSEVYTEYGEAMRRESLKAEFEAMKLFGLADVLNEKRPRTDADLTQSKRAKTV